MNKKYAILLSYLKKLESAAIAFSGGIDSTFLLYSCLKALPSSNITSITINSSFLSQSEYQNIIKLLNYFKLNYKILEIDILSNDFVKNNSFQRCYYCKKIIFTRIIHEAKKLKITNILEGSNYDDLSDYRPGLKALNELNIISPLKMAKLTKKDIRELSKKFNIPIWSKPSMSCLASRVPYETTITKHKLFQIEESEKILSSYGFNTIRVRHHEEIARIELFPNEWHKLLNTQIKDEIIEKIKNIGFKYVTLDLNGYVQGSLNTNMTDK